MYFMNVETLIQSNAEKGLFNGLGRVQNVSHQIAISIRYQFPPDGFHLLVRLMFKQSSIGLLWKILFAILKNRPLGVLLL